MYGRCPVVYVAIMADNARSDEELEYSYDVVVEFEDICVAHEITAGILAPSSIPFRLQALSEDILVRVAKRI